MVEAVHITVRSTATVPPSCPSCRLTTVPVRPGRRPSRFLASCSRSDAPSFRSSLAAQRAFFSPARSRPSREVVRGPSTSWPGSPTGPSPSAAGGQRAACASVFLVLVVAARRIGHAPAALVFCESSRIAEAYDRLLSRSSPVGVESRCTRVDEARLERQFVRRQAHRLLGELAVETPSSS